MIVFCIEVIGDKTDEWRSKMYAQTKLIKKELVKI
jgi:hypothetical protein